MLIALLIIGLMLISTSLQNTQHELGRQLQLDFLGSGGFLAWAAGIMAIGAIGLIPGLRSPSRYLLALIGVVFVVSNQGIFSGLQAALQGISASGPAPSIPAPQIATGNASQSSGTGSSGGIGQTAANVAAQAGVTAALALL